MRINKYIAKNTSYSRRQADKLIAEARVTINDSVAELGSIVSVQDTVFIDNNKIEESAAKSKTLLLHKPVGYVCSKDGQGSPTVYDLLPANFYGLNIAGRLDKDSSGLVVLTSDGELLHNLTHPSSNKEKIYEVETDRVLTKEELFRLKTGVDIGDVTPSRFKDILSIGDKKYQVILVEGRNRQIRRTLHSIHATVRSLHRTQIGAMKINTLRVKKFILL